MASSLSVVSPEIPERKAAIVTPPVLEEKNR